MMTTKHQVHVGTRFARTDVRPYVQYPLGSRVHSFTDLCEVTEADETGLGYRVIKRVSEAGRNPYDRTSDPVSGRYGWSDWQAALDDERVILTQT